MIIAPNILVIAGNGRNVGKTTLACNIIASFSKTAPIVGVKISKHMHEIAPHAQVIYNSPDAQIIEENNATLTKDSSKMLAAGASKVYYIQVKTDNELNKIVSIFLKLIENTACVCESGAIASFVKPAGVIYCTQSNTEFKNDLHKNADVIIVDFNFHKVKISLQNIRWQIQ